MGCDEYVARGFAGRVQVFQDEKTGKVRWESGSNRVFTVPVGCTGKAAKRNFWS